MQAKTDTMAMIQAQGSLNASNALDFQDRLMGHLEAETSLGLLVDMGQLESLDSAGLIALVAALQKARQLDKRLYLCSVPAGIRMIFELTQLDRVFEILEEGANSALMAA
jgi:anti-anti-sigma factor